MKQKLVQSIVISVVCIAAWQARCEAAEIALRPTSSPSGTVVRLRDVAEIRGTPGTLGEFEQQLADFPLLPAPAPGTKQFLSARQIRDMLEAGGVAVAVHRFTGASQVVVGTDTPQVQPRVQRMTTAQSRRVENDLREAVARHLSKLAGVEHPWQIELSLADEQLRLLAETSVPWMIEGGREPWIGGQRLAVVCETREGVVRTELMADVTLPEPVVVLTRPVQQRATITPADVALAYPDNATDQRLLASALRSEEEVVGKVARRSLREGQMLLPTMLEEPTLVRRGETVKVIALAHGIRITTFARARQNGAHGDLVYVESLQTREPFAAHVSGVREVQVLGR